jgi:catechol 2,3-dioxygenase-like lactoylglutathione lyase family enzyme
MLNGVCVGTNDLKAAGAFYDDVLATIGMARLAEDEVEIGYGPPGGVASFWVLTPFNKGPATVGNGVQVMFAAPSQDGVHAFYKAALAAGGADEGRPGPRSYSAGYYGAYCRDLDGNKLHVSYVSV